MRAGLGRTVVATGSGGAMRLGPRVLLPGGPQWEAGQRDRARVFAGSYVAAMAVGLFAWGTAIGASLLTFAAVMHIASAADAIRRSAFPGYGAWGPWFAAAVGLGSVCYLPALLVVVLLACPAWEGGAGYLVDRLAYRREAPRAGQLVWLADREGRGADLRLVAAGGGQRVEWTREGLRIDGGPPLPGTAGLGGNGPWRVDFEVPEGQLAVLDPARLAAGRAAGPPLDALTVVPADRAIGRAWARAYPIWERRLTS